MHGEHRGLQALRGVPREPPRVRRRASGEWPLRRLQRARCHEPLRLAHRIEAQMKARLISGPEARRVLQRSSGRCVVRAVAHGPTYAQSAIVGPAFASGAACCDACLVAIGVAKAPVGEVKPTLLPGVE